MGILKNVTDFFRNATPVDGPIDKYGILAPLLAASEYVETTKKMMLLLRKDQPNLAILLGNAPAKTLHEEKAQIAYKAFLNALPGHDQSGEKSDPLSSILTSLDWITKNIESVEDNFSPLFGDIIHGDESAIRTSSLLVVGYLEQTNRFLNWLGILSAHVLDDGDTIPPFWTKTLLEGAKPMSGFVANNLNKWYPKAGGLLSTVRHIQQTGADVAIKTGDSWMDDFIHDNQFTVSEQELLSASIAHPAMMFSRVYAARKESKIERDTARKDWLIAKIALEEAHLAGVDSSSLEYKRLKKARDHYVTVVTKYEQKIERARA